MTVYRRRDMIVRKAALTVRSNDESDGMIRTGEG